jgi:predicted  nucleic acid-binding Zn-ribbon protein
MLKTCSKCGEEFDLVPGRPGLAAVCPSCTQSREETARKAAVQERERKAWIKATKDNERQREKATQDDEWLAILGLIKVPDSRFTVNVPMERNSRPRKAG